MNETDPAKSSPSARTVDNAEATTPAFDRRSLRLPPRPTGEVPPVELFRLRESDDGTLELAAPTAMTSTLRIPDGVLGEAERMLGRAMPAKARELVEPLVQGSDAALRDEARGIVVRAVLMDGRLDEARALLGEDRARDALPVGLALADAALCLSEGNAARGMQRFAAVRAQQPGSIGLAYVEALLAVAQGEMGQALELLTDVASVDDTHAVARYQLGQLFAAQGDTARAGTVYEMAWEIAPQFLAPPIALAEMLAEGRQVLEALQILQRASELVPTAIAPRQMQLRILLDIGERDAALELGRMLHDHVPGDPDIALLYAGALLESGSVTSAAELVEGTLKSPTLDSAQLLRARRLSARIAVEGGDIDSATSMLRDAARGATPAQSGEVWVELMHLAAAQERPADLDEALVGLLHTTDLGSLVTGALLSRQRGLFARSRAIAMRARDLVQGTPAEMQLDAFLAALPG